MNDKVLIFGKGYIGLRLSQKFGWDVSKRRINSYFDVEEELSNFKPGIVINCIGHTGRNVDDCELDKDKTIRANTFVPLLLAEGCIRRGIRLVHISSGCIYHYDYEEDSPIDEEKIPDYFNLFYSRTKIYSDRALEALSLKYKILILRIRVPLDNIPHPKNLLTKLISYKKIINLPNSVTYIPDFIEALSYLISIDANGIYNVVNKNGLYYPDLLDEYKKYKSDFMYELIDYKNLKLERTNLILSTKKLENTGFKVRGIKKVIPECVKDYIRYL